MAKSKEEDEAKPSEEETKPQTKKRRRSAPAPEPPNRADDRWPSRERKQVERFSVPVPRRVSLPKNPKFEEGPGIKLREIPNVHFKMSKRKADENLNVLHTIIYGKRSNVHCVKKNILQFSGYVWSEENKEKERTKVKEKIDKCTKDKLIDFCQLFDIPLNKAIIRKEELSTKLMEFLESPNVTRAIVLAEKSQQGKKRKRAEDVKQDISEGTSSDGGSKGSGSKVKAGRIGNLKIDEDDESEKGEPEDKENNSVPRKKSSNKSSNSVSTSKTQKRVAPISKGGTEYNEDKKKAELKKKSSGKSKEVKENSSASNESNEPSLSEPSKSSKKSIKKGSSAAKSDSKTLGKDPSKDSKKVSTLSKKSASSKNNGSSPPSVLKPKKDSKVKGSSSNKPFATNKRASKKEATNSSSKVPAKDKGKVKGNKGKAIKEPSRKEMLSVVSEILKDVDFDVVTLADILKQLESHFHIDLKGKNKLVKSVIEEVIHNMPSDEEEGSDDDSKEQAEGEEEQEEQEVLEEDNEKDEDEVEGSEDDDHEEEDEDPEVNHEENREEEEDTEGTDSDK